MRRFCLILLGAVVWGACGGGGGGPQTITSVVVSGDSTVVLAGTRQLTATAMGGGTPISTGVTFQWSSSDTTRATVSASGLVSGVRLGSATITALAVLNGTPTTVSSAAHAVRTRIGRIIFTPFDLSFSSLHDTVIVSADARDAQNASVAGITFTWVSRNAGVATASDSGVRKGIVSAVANGTAEIVATGDGVSDSVTAMVQQVAVSLSITPHTATFHRIGATLAPVVTALDARGNAMTAIGWSSQNSAAATVNATSGLITSVNEGSSLVIGTSGALSDTVHVGVALVYTSVNIATTGPLPAPIDSGVINRLNGSLQLGVIVKDSGNTIVPNPQGIAWSLKHSGTVGTIGASSGLVTGNANTGRDTVVLVARTARDSVPLVVRQMVGTIAVTPANPAPLNFTGDTARFAAQPRDSGGAAIPGLTIAWSTNNAVLGINSAGLATAARSNATGINVKVRASTSGVTDSSTTIVVKQVPASASLDPNSFGTLSAFGRQAAASCVVLDSASDTIPNHPCTWSAVTAGVVSFNPAIAKTTTITAIGNGTTTIRAQAATSLFGFNSVTVDQVAASVSLLPANLGTPDVQMTVSQSAPFYAEVRDSTNNVDTRARTDVAWSITPGTHASLSASTSGAVTVTSNTTTGPETVRATIGSIFGERIVAVAATGIGFAANVQPIFTANCISCHTGAGAPEGMSLAAGVAYTAIFEQAAGEVSALKRVRAFRPDSSYLVHKIQGTQATVGGFGSRMPLGCTTNCLPNATINIIRNWILQGAPNN